MWELVIPTSMLHLGGVLLLMSFAVQWITPENNRLAIIFALIGGFGVGGGVGGWLGGALHGTTTSIASFTERWTHQLVGTGYGFLVFAILALIAWTMVRKSGKGSGGRGSGGGKGSGGGGKKSKKEHAKQTAWLLAFSLLGTAIAGFPEIYGWSDQAVSAMGSAAISMMPGW